MFGLKDIFTTINLLGGCVALGLCIEGEPFAASIALVLGYLCGDSLDGWVARMLDSANKFGASYDSIADHMSQCIAPAAIVYTVYGGLELLPSSLGNQLLAMFLSSTIIVAGTIRHARNEVYPVEYKGVWAGMPRTVLGFIAIALANAAAVPFMPGGMWLGVVLIPLLSAAALTRLPFPNHHMARKHVWYVRVLIGLFFLSMVTTLALAWRFVFDVLLLWMLGYSFLGWLSLDADERQAYRQAARAAAAHSATE